MRSSLIGRERELVGVQAEIERLREERAAAERDVDEAWEATAESPAFGRSDRDPIAEAVERPLTASDLSDNEIEAERMRRTAAKRPHLLFFSQDADGRWLNARWGGRGIVVALGGDGQPYENPDVILTPPEMLRFGEWLRSKAAAAPSQVEPVATADPAPAAADLEPSAGNVAAPEPSDDPGAISPEDDGDDGCGTADFWLARWERYASHADPAARLASSIERMGEEISRAAHALARDLGAIAPVTRREALQVEAIDETERGAGGFGSTGR